LLGMARVVFALSLGRSKGLGGQPDPLSFNVAGWRGWCIRVDARSSRPIGKKAGYLHSVAHASSVLELTTWLDEQDGGSSNTPVRDVLSLGEETDMDLDGTFSTEYRDGCAMYELLRDACNPVQLAAESDGASANVADDAPTAALVLEHALAVSDTERRRCMLAYDQEGALVDVLLMSEARSPDKASVPPSEPPVASAASGVLSLLGTWQGDAVVRRPSKSKASKGFGTGLPRGGKGGRSMQKARGGAVASKLFEKDVTVFKSRVEYNCDGEYLSRTVGITSFKGDDLGEISTIGRVVATSGEWSDHEAVVFDRTGDASEPMLLFLPAGCHVLAPRRIAPLYSDAPGGQPAQSFSTEFAAILEPGESFGWMGYVPGKDGDVTIGDESAKSESSRLVRVGRLYSSSDTFVSGTTSLCTAMDDV